MLKIYTRTIDDNEFNDALPPWCLIEVSDDAIGKLARASQLVQASKRSDLPIFAAVICADDLGLSVKFYDQLAPAVASAGDVIHYDEDVEADDDLDEETKETEARLRGLYAKVYRDSFIVHCHEKWSGDNVYSSMISFRDIDELKHLLPIQPGV